MKRWFLALLASSFVLPAVSFAEERSLNLEDAFASVDKVNLNVLISREAVAQAIGAAGQQRSSILPQVTLDAEQRRQRSVQVSARGPSSGQPTNRFVASIGGNYTLLSPSQIAAYRAAKRGIAVAELDYQQALQDVLGSVAQTYFLHQRNLQRVAVFDANIERARALLDLARRQLGAGVATQIDVTRAEAQLAVAEQARLQQDTTVVQSELQLKRLLDLDSAVTLTLVPFNVRRAEQALMGTVIEESVYERRADFLAEQKALERNRELLRAAKWQRFGELSAFGEYGYTTARALDGNEQKSWMGGIGISIPVFDGLRTSADQRIALAQMRSQEYRLRNLRLVISSELRLAVQDARSRNAQVEVAERTLRLAGDELVLAQRRYEQGVADNREVVEAQNRLAEASDNRVEAVYQYNLSRLNLAQARGDTRGILSERAE